MNYNGWANYETWAVHLWLTNDEATYRLCRTLAAQASAEAAGCPLVQQGTWHVQEATQALLADRLQKHVEEQNPLVEQPSLYADLLNAALGEVHWPEVADAFLTE